MRGKWFLGIVAGAFLVGGFPAPAAAQDTPDEYADEWTEARRGDRDWMQRATEQLTTGPIDRMMGRAADATMKEMINRIISQVEGMYEQRRDPCLAAAVNMAHYQTITTGRQTIMRGAADMFFSAAGGAAGGGEIREFLGRRLAEQIKDKLQEKLFEKFKEDVRDHMKRGLPEHFEDDDRRGKCRTEFRLIWNKAAERYEFLFAGDCQCDMVSCGKQGGAVPLRRWTLTGWGSVIPEVTQAANGDKTIRFAIGMPQDVSLTADCCVEGDRRFRTAPANGAGNAWVGYEPPPVTAPPQTTPAPRPQTGSTSPASGPTGTTGRQPRPTRPPTIDVPVIPDGPLTDAEMEQLEQRVFSTEELAQSERQKADANVTNLERSNASPEAIAEAKAAAEAAAATHRAARAAREKFTEKLNQQQQQQEEQSSIVPPEKLDRVSATILAVHNQARAEVGVQPLLWDSALAASAAAYGPVLSRAGRLVHAPRAGRENERENLLISQRGYRSPEQMVRVWTSEKRNYMPGLFPNISRTGNWADAAHYTQVVWRATTRVGCAIHRDSKFDFLICRYSPPGNRDGKPVL